MHKAFPPFFVFPEVATVPVHLCPLAIPWPEGKLCGVAVEAREKAAGALAKKWGGFLFKSTGKEIMEGLLEMVIFVNNAYGCKTKTIFYNFEKN